ncbi:hypothetical protein FRC07_005380 [Ceratobasidium sp. 392]|nr:hypothetical protein FRC07_005380 [Ceratobasidium sp. 392]
MAPKSKRPAEFADCSSFRKRKTADDAGSSGNSYLSREELRNRLSKCRQKNIGIALLDSIGTATPPELRTIQSLLAPLLENATIPLHCVRCHAQYTEPANHSSACNIEHTDDIETTKAGGGMYLHRFPCCEKEFESDSYDDPYDGPEGFYCFTGSHTTDQEEVDYDVEDGGSKNILTKRKTVDDADSEGEASSKVQPMSAPELCTLLARCPLSKIVGTLTKSIKEATPEQISVVQSLLAPLLTKAVKPLHCVRCHEVYFESSNNDNACKIEHEEPVDDDAPYILEGGWKKAVYRYPCCGETFASAWGPPEEHTICYTAPHTTNPDDVDYERVDYEKGEEMETCSIRGCLVDNSDDSDDSDRSNGSG